MTKIAIVTDSTAYLPTELVEKYQIRVLPLRIHWEDETYLDGIDLTPEIFYPRLEQSKLLPTTSQTPMYDFLTLFNQLAEEHEGIILPLISSGISGTIASALAAQEEFNKIPVAVIDTKSTAAAQALVVLAAAHTLEQGGSFEQAVAAARKAAEDIDTYFVVDTLKYLHKGGRIGGASRYFGTTLQIKPILFFNQDGKIDALERVRTKGKALKRLVDLAQEKANGSKVSVGIMHSVAPQEAERVRQEIETRIECNEVITVELSPVIGTHVGPGTIGVAVYSH
jgi:DegV family protein with EDD domain